MPLNPKQFETALQAVTLQMLGIAIDNPQAGSFVRIGWQTDGQPVAKDPSVDVCTLRAVEEDSDYNRIRDRSLTVETNTTDQVTEQYTRVWRVYWVLYGPNSFDRARQIRSGLLSETIHDLLAAIQVYLVTDMTAPIRVPEQFQGQWWERVDFEAAFNENVLEQTEVSTVISSEVIVENAAGIAADFTVPGE